MTTSPNPYIQLLQTLLTLNLYKQKNPNTQTKLNKQTQPITLISAYSPKLTISLYCDPDEDRTKQSFKDECDVNVIMARYMATGILDFNETVQGQYGDATGNDFQTAMEVIAGAQSMFNELPAKIRDRFKNEPAAFLDFVHDPDNAKEMAEMGLLTPQAASKYLTPTPTIPAANSTPPDAPVKAAPVGEKAASVKGD